MTKLTVGRFTSYFQMFQESRDIFNFMPIYSKNCSKFSQNVPKFNFKCSKNSRDSQNCSFASNLNQIY